MTDKQIRTSRDEIIIDGVDVSVCEHNYNKNLGEYCMCNLYPPPLNCKYHSNCLFKQLARKTQECEELRRSITKVFVCLIKANRCGKIIDTLWVDNIMTLWDYIALTLGIEGDQTQTEKQILQKISEVNNDR